MDQNDPKLQVELERMQALMRLAGADLTGHMLPLPFVWVNLGCPSNTLERISCSPAMTETCHCGVKGQRYIHASIHKAAVKNALGFVNNVYTLITDLRDGTDPNDPASIKVKEILTTYIGQMDGIATHYNNILEAIDGMDKLERKLG